MARLFIGSKESASDVVGGMDELLNARAVFFDLFETLITERKDGRNIADIGTPDCESPAVLLGMAESDFEREWAARRPGRLKGQFQTYDAVLADICTSMHVHVEEDLLHSLHKKRVAVKRRLFEQIHPPVLQMLSDVKRAGFTVGLVSNCSAEEIEGLFSSPFVDYMDDIVLSCEVGFSKPEPEMYLLACQKLQVHPSECIFIGDGGANELMGAKRIGMKPIQATWFLERELGETCGELEKVTDVNQVVRILSK